jgi:hypothetical protein
VLKLEAFLKRLVAEKQKLLDKYASSIQSDKETRLIDKNKKLLDQVAHLEKLGNYITSQANNAAISAQRKMFEKVYQHALKSEAFLKELVAEKQKPLDEYASSIQSIEVLDFTPRRRFQTLNEKGEQKVWDKND